MATASDRVVTVFGGTGFLGRRIVRHLRLNGFYVRVGSRQPDRGHRLIGPDDPQLRSIKVDVGDQRSVIDALADAYGAVNAVSLYVERGLETFHSVHVESAQRIAAQAQRAGVKRLIHVSGIGADPRSQSLYIRKRGEGELAVREAFAEAILIRPAVMFGPDDAFLNAMLKLFKRLPFFPMFGKGQMRLQPVSLPQIKFERIDGVIHRGAASQLCCQQLGLLRSRCILAQRQMRASFIVISLIRFEHVAKMPLAKHNYIVQAIPPDRADQPFRIAVLPW